MRARFRVRVPAILLVGWLSLIAGCGSPTPSTSASATALPYPLASCLTAPVNGSGQLHVTLTATVANKPAGIDVYLKGFTGAQTYTVHSTPQTRMQVVLRPGEPQTEQARVISRLLGIDGVTAATVGSPFTGSSKGLIPTIDVTVATGAQLANVPRGLNGDPAVDPAFTATLFEVAEETTPIRAYVDIDRAPIVYKATAGTVTPSDDGHAGTFDLTFAYPYVTATQHLTVRWACPPTVVLGGTGGTALGTPAEVVTMSDGYAFSPATVTVKVGQIVEWRNTGTVRHEIAVVGDDAMSSPTLARGDVWQVRFTIPGAYAYVCGLHVARGEKGTVVVTS